MSSSSQHGASQKRKRDAAQDSESQDIDDARKRICGLTRILEEPNSSCISDEAILFNATSAIKFLDDFKNLVTATDISISNPRDILEDIGMDAFGRLFIMRWKQSDHTYHRIFRNTSYVIGNKRNALKATKELLGQVYKLPGISPCISSVWDLCHSQTQPPKRTCRMWMSRSLVIFAARPRKGSGRKSQTLSV